MTEQLKQLIQDVREDGPSSSPDWVEALDALESKLDNFSPWISVEDALPEEGGERILALWSCQDISFLKAKDIGTDEYTSVVTHWMPLPQPPKSPKE